MACGAEPPPGRGPRQGRRTPAVGSRALAKKTGTGCTVIVIVSGVPRSGTSLMMQMLAAGGMPVLSDGLRQADPDNPRGYYEWEKIKCLPQEPALIGEAEGKAVKVISSLLFALPAGHDYRVISMLRPLHE